MLVIINHLVAIVTPALSTCRPLSLAFKITRKPGSSDQDLGHDIYTSLPPNSATHSSNISPVCEPPALRPCHGTPRPDVPNLGQIRYPKSASHPPITDAFRPSTHHTTVTANSNNRSIDERSSQTACPLRACHEMCFITIPRVDASTPVQSGQQPRAVVPWRRSPREPRACSRSLWS